MPPWSVNLLKRLVKTPRIHLLDSGLTCYLLGVRSPEELRHHPLRGPIFESWVVAEVYKSWVHAGLTAPLYHLRQTRGRELDLIVDAGTRTQLVEIKSGATVASDWFRTLHELGDKLPESERFVVMGGDAAQTRSGVRVVPWSAVHTLTGA